MKSATELLAEMLALHADPQKGAAELYLWLHHRKGEVKAAVERGDDSGRLREFFESLATDVWNCCDIDGCDFQDRAVKLGLFVKVPATEEIKAEYDCDEMYTWSWSPLAIDLDRGEGE